VTYEKIKTEKRIITVHLIVRKEVHVLIINTMRMKNVKPVHLIYEKYV
jgi:hypothetical protein